MDHISQCVSVIAWAYVGHVAAARGAPINGHVQPPRAVKVDTLLTEEKARAKLINEAKLKFGIIDEIDVSGVRLYLNKGMQFDIGQGVGCQTWHVAQHGPWWQTGSVVSRCGPYPPSDPPFVQVGPFWLWGRGYPPPKLAAAGGPRGGSEAQVGPFGQGRG